MLNWYLRYEPVIAVLDEFGAERALDVGAGWHGLSRWWPHDVVQTDLAFQGDPPTGHRVGQVEYVPASAENLPFEDGSFDFAVSLDMMEHLPQSIRSAAVSELARVSRRGFIIGYPVGDSARVLDERFARWYAKRGEPLPDWLKEHLAQEQYPDERTLLDGLPEGWRIARRLNAGNEFLQRSIVFAEASRFGSLASRAIERTICKAPRLAAAVNLGNASHRGLWLALPNSATG